MSLFPAYSTNAEKEVEEIIEIPQENRPKSWLTNESFVTNLANESTNSVTETDVKPTDVDLEIIYEKSDSSSPVVVSEKKRKKKKHKREKSENIKKLKYEKPKHEKIDSIFIQSDPLKPSSSSKSNLYVFDLKRDIENLHFGIYKKQRALFKLKINYVLGGNEKINSLMFAVDEIDAKKRKLKEKRYYNQKFHRIAADPLQILPQIQRANKNFQSNFGEEFLPIVSEIEINDEKLIYDSKIQMYRPVSSLLPSNDPLLLGDDSEISLDDVEIARENKRFNKILNENPNDIELWKKFLSFQDSFYAINARRDNVRMTKLALLERKLAILDKAMQQNSNSYELKLLRMDLGLEAGWDREKLKDEWKKLEFTHINQPTVWIGRLKFAYSHFSQFTVGRQSSLFDHCLDKLSVVLKNQLVTHPCLPHTEDFFVDCLVAKIDLWKNSGHYEKAVALFQALMEFNFRQPEILKRISSLNEKRKFFEPFWDANCPRLGENGALGWSQVMQNKSTTEPENESLDDDLDKKEEEIYSNNSKNQAQIWFEIENLRQSFHWKPYRGVDEPEDSERIVLLDDIENSLYEIVEPHNRFFFILKSLRILGVHLPSLFSSNAIVWYDDEAETAFDIFENLPKLNKFSSNFHGFDKFLTNLFEQISSLLDDKIYKMYLICVRIFHFVVTLSSNGDISSKDKLKIFTKFAKEILSKDEYRSEIAVYGAYADGLCKLGFFNEAINVLQTTLLNIKTNVFSLPVNSFAQLIHLNLFNLYVFCHFKNITDIRNVKDLSKSLSKFVMNGCLSKNDDGEEEINVVRAMKAFSDLIVNLETKFSSETNSFVAAWFGDSLSLTTNLYSIYSYFTTKNIEKSVEILTTCRKRLAAVRDVCDKNDVRYLSIDRDVERCFTNEIHLINFHVKNSFGPPKLLSDCVVRCLDEYPANGNFLKIYCDINLHVQLISKLRRFFSSPLTKRTIWWIANVYAEFSFYLKIKEQNNFCETHKLKHVFETALESCRDSSVLWRLYIKMAPFWSDDASVKKIFYQAIRQCPNSKDLYMEGVRLFPDDVQIFVDLMTEKELRVRLPWEELNLLIESSKKISDDNQSDVSDENEKNHSDAI